MGVGSVPATRRPAVGEDAGSVEALLAAVAVKDPYTAGHAHRVAVGSELIGRGLGTARRAFFSGCGHRPVSTSASWPCRPRCRTDRRRRRRSCDPRQRGGPGAGAGCRRRPGVLHHHERMDGHCGPVGAEDDPRFARAAIPWPRPRPPDALTDGCARRPRRWTSCGWPPGPSSTRSWSAAFAVSTAPKPSRTSISAGQGRRP